MARIVSNKSTTSLNKARKRGTGNGQTCGSLLCRLRCSSASHAPRPTAWHAQGGARACVEGLAWHSPCLLLACMLLAASPCFIEWLGLCTRPGKRPAANSPVLEEGMADPQPCLTPQQPSSVHSQAQRVDSTTTCAGGALGWPGGGAAHPRLDREVVGPVVRSGVCSCQPFI